MVRYLTFFTAVVFAACVVAADPETARPTVLDSGAIVVVRPPTAPISVSSFEGSIKGKELTIHFVIRNESEEQVYRPGVAMIIFDADRNPVGALTYRHGVGIGAGRLHTLELTLPLSRSFNSDTRIVVIPIAASSTSGAWQVPAAKLQLLVNRLSSSSWNSPAQALALGRDVLPLGETVQQYPPNCTLSQCAENRDECNSNCAFYGYFDTCAYCDRRRTGEGCSTICYCLSITEGPCPPPPDGWIW